MKKIPSPKDKKIKKYEKKRKAKEIAESSNVDDDVENSSANESEEYMEEEVFFVVYVFLFTVIYLGILVKLLSIWGNMYFFKLICIYWSADMYLGISVKLICEDDSIIVKIYCCINYSWRVYWLYVFFSINDLYFSVLVSVLIW